MEVLKYSCFFQTSTLGRQLENHKASRLCASYNISKAGLNNFEIIDLEKRTDTTLMHARMHLLDTSTYIQL